MWVEKTRPRIYQIVEVCDSAIKVHNRLTNTIGIETTSLQ